MISAKLRRIVGSSIRRVVLPIAAAAALVVAGPAAAVVSPLPPETPLFNAPVWATVYSGGIIYVGGDFTSVISEGVTRARTRLAAIDAATGKLLSWAPSANGRVRAIAVSGGSVYAGGFFTAISGQARDALASIDATTGAVRSFKHAFGGGKPYSLSAANGRLYAGGTFTTVDGVARTRLAAFNLSTGALDTGWLPPAADDQVEVVAAKSTRVYVGGKFHKLNGVSGTAKLAAVNPTTGALDTSFKPNATVIARALAVTADRVYAAYGGQGGRLIAYNLAGATQWTLAQDGDAQAVTVLDNVVYLGGHFDNVCSTPRTGDQGVCLDGSLPRIKFAAVGLSGNLLSWTAHANGIAGVRALDANPALGQIAAGGEFTFVSGQNRKRFATFK